MSDKKDKKELVLTYLLRKAIKERDSELAKRLLKKEKDLHLKKKELGVYFQLQNWREAKQFLNTLPNNSESIRNFKTVQNINLDRFQSNTKFRLSDAQKQSLLSIAEGEDYDNSGNAKSLLSLLEGMRFYERMNRFNGSGAVEMRASTTLKQIEKPITISPNPANHKVIIDIPEHHNIRTIVFYDINGAITKTVLTTAAFLETDLTECHEGLYIVKFLDSDNIVKHTAKLFVNK